MSPHRTENENFRKFGAVYRHGTVFAPKQYLYQKEALEMQRTKILSLDWCKKGTNLYGASNYPHSCIAIYRADNANFRNFGASYRNGMVFAPKQYLYQKEALVMQSTKILSLGWCKKGTNLFRASNYPSSCVAIQGRECKFRKLRGFLSPWYRVCTKTIFISKGSLRNAEHKNIIIGLV